MILSKVVIRNKKFDTNACEELNQQILVGKEKKLPEAAIVYALICKSQGCDVFSMVCIVVQKFFTSTEIILQNLKI